MTPAGPAAEGVETATLSPPGLEIDADSWRRRLCSESSWRGSPRTAPGRSSAGPRPLHAAPRTMSGE